MFFFKSTENMFIVRWFKPTKKTTNIETQETKAHQYLNQYNGKFKADYIQKFFRYNNNQVIKDLTNLETNKLPQECKLYLILYQQNLSHIKNDKRAEMLQPLYTTIIYDALSKHDGNRVQKNIRKIIEASYMLERDRITLPSIKITDSNYKKSISSQILFNGIPPNNSNPLVICLHFSTNAKIVANSYLEGTDFHLLPLTKIDAMYLENKKKVSKTFNVPLPSFKPLFDQVPTAMPFADIEIRHGEDEADSIQFKSS